MLHDWVYENRAIYLTELNKLGASVKLLDPHRVLIDGPDAVARSRARLPAGAAACRGHSAGHAGGEGTSVLRSVYVIHRGYEDLAERLNTLGAQIESFRDI
jgi:UDP-N-acetylglucosamine 1-carboxyvinyltransferase